MSGIFSQQETNLWDYVYVLKKRKAAIAAAFILIVAAGVFFTYRAAVIYKATTTILIERENPNIVDFKEVMAFDASTTDYYQTQYQMLESRSLIDELIQAENLIEDPYLRGMKAGGIRKLLKKVPFYPDWLMPFVTDRSLDALIARRMLSVDPVRNSRLVKVSISHEDPQKAASVANTLVKLFIKKNLENRFLISRQATEMLADQLEELKLKVAQAEKNLQDYKEKNGLIAIPSMHVKDDFIQEAKLELVKTQAEEARLEKRYLPAHPKLIHVRSVIDALKAKIAEEENKKLELGRVAIDYGELEREAASARQIYETLLSRFQEMHSEAKSQASNILVVDEARAPERPDQPKPFINFLAAMFLGLMSGIALAFFLEYLDDTVKIPDDVEKGLSLELLGIVPNAEKDRKGPLGGELLLPQNGRPSQAAEAFRALRTALISKTRHIAGCRVFVVTSPNPSEGKSTISLNLAAAFSQNQSRVLLIDADLRKPKLHSRLKMPNSRGLTDVLEAKAVPSEVILSNAQSCGFDLLLSGTETQRAIELLGGERMNRFLSDMKMLYDIILIDSPPFLAVADSVVLSDYADVLTIIANYQNTEKRHLKDLKKRFSGFDHKLIGVVINQVKVRENDYYYHHHYYYGYGQTAPQKS
ncbi:MAG: polysaccharide biosynthesis tyrosine autokinase [Candidatus Omnitrophica bacterium]|nr:polysaccharide biosynthesis tyrosine autokinase [Candidatus Omnitrophota bacterium]